MIADKSAYLTPPRFLVPVRAYFGGQIALDPCTCADNPTGALHFFTRAQDGLAMSWEAGRSGVFMNPPWSRDAGLPIAPWIYKALAEHRNSGVPSIGLVPAATDTAIIQEYLRHATATCFIRGRILHLDPDTRQPARLANGKPGTPKFGSLMVLLDEAEGAKNRFSELFTPLGVVL